MRVLRGKNTPPKLNPIIDYIADVRELFSGFRQVLLVKDSLKVHCSCYDDLEHSYDSKHDVCLGTGWIPLIEKHHAWYQVAGVPQSLPRMIDLNEPANIATNAKFFYFFRNAVACEGDEIVITQFDDNGLPIINNMEFYIINHWEPKYDELGRLIYHKASCERNAVESQARSLEIYNKIHLIREIPLI